MIYDYEKYTEDRKVIHCPENDIDGKITGQVVFGLRQWFDEHEEERIRLGWTKHIAHKMSEIEYDPQTQYVEKSVVAVDEFTIEDVLYLCDKTPEIFTSEVINNIGQSFFIFGGEQI